MFRIDQEPVTRYKHLLSVMQQQRSPRGNWRNPISYPSMKPMYDTPLPPVYQSGLHAFRCMDATYLKESVTPEQYKLLKGFVTRIKDAFNAVYFGRADNKFYVVIDPSQDEQFARLIVRFHLITGLDIRLVDPGWYSEAVAGRGEPDTTVLIAKARVLDLRNAPLEIVRKLSRWKLQYSPAFDGLVQYDRLDQLIIDINTPMTRVTPVYNKKSEPTVKIERRRPVPLTASQARMLSSTELDQFESAKYDYRRWCYFINNLVDEIDYTHVRCNLYFDMKLTASLKKLLQQYDCIITQHPTKTYLYLPPKRKLPFVRITDAKSLDSKLLLKLAKILLADTQ